MKKVIDNTNYIAAPEADYLYISTSQLPNSGNGLFTAIVIYKDEVIAKFDGEIINALEAKARVDNGIDQYFVNLLDGSTLDSRSIMCFAKYANDVKGSKISVFKNNAKIALDDNDEVCLIATRSIKAGAEIFCSYGKSYWIKHG